MFAKRAISIIALMGLAAIFAGGMFSFVKAAPPSDTFVYATGSGPVDMDPIYAWDSASIDVIDQVCQPLMWYNVTEPNAPLEPLLAASMPTVSSNNTQYNFTLRQGVFFHDGNPFNASAAKWNLDRLNYFVDPACPSSDGQTQTASLYLWNNGTFIIKNVKVLGTYELQINLNVPYGPFLNLLTFSSADMLSPVDTPIHNLLSYATLGENMTGTGPYTFGKWDAPNGKVYFTANPNYWGQAAKIHYLVFDVILDSQTLDQTMLAKQDSFTVGQLPANYAAESAAGSGLTVANSPKTLAIEYLSMNNVLMNVTYREALSYCFDYNYFLNTIDLGLVSPLYGVIPDGMTYYNPAIPHVFTNVTFARQLLIDAKVAPTDAAKHLLDNSTNTAWWTHIATHSSPVASFNITYNTDNANRLDIALLMQTDAAKLGISIIIIGVTWPQFLHLLFASPMKMQMFCLGWLPDFNDPDDYVGPLLSNDSSSNGALVNDSTLQALMLQGRTATTNASRQAAYDAISTRIQNVTFPYIWLDQGINHEVHLSTVMGYPDNKEGLNYFSYCWYSTSGSSGPTLPGFDMLLISLATGGMFVCLVLVNRKKFMQ